MNANDRIALMLGRAQVNAELLGDQVIELTKQLEEAKAKIADLEKPEDNP